MPAFAYLPDRGPRNCGSAVRRIMNKRFYLFCATTWTAAAILILGNGAMSTDVLSGVVALAGFDLLRP